MEESPSRAQTAGANDVREVELWDPTTEQWTQGPRAAAYGGYHSTVALLSSGALFSAGGGVPGPAANFNAELYLPPYLFRRSGGTSVRATRPKIILMSSVSLGYNQLLQLETTTQFIREISLIALPAVTHSFDSNQRRMTLQWTPAAVGIDVTTPMNANLAPPGYYYLSIVDTTGTPSSAVIIAIASEAPPLPKGLTTGPVPSPGPLGPYPEITGAFAAETRVVFNNPSGGNWQRVFDFGNGPAHSTFGLDSLATRTQWC